MLAHRSSLITTVLWDFDYEITENALTRIPATDGTGGFLNSGCLPPEIPHTSRPAAYIRAS
ncbi:hypothetical protein F3Q19_16555 [Salmonella enterica subsp. enterica]|nr:hypothetical protein [Salmonella enterica subsp. enterica]ECW0788973.1 hypothetical protein [Salmonella enterica subsp. enterica]